MWCNFIILQKTEVLKVLSKNHCESTNILEFNVDQSGINEYQVSIPLVVNS
jgi:hypothetical protein